MERRPRRYVPGSEGLEGRRLLSTVPVAAPPTPIPAEVASASDTAPAPLRVQGQEETAGVGAESAAQRRRPADQPLTPAQERARQQLIQTRLTRIDRLPAFLRSLDPGRPLPEEAVSVIQQELRGFVGKLRPPAPPVAEGFVDLIRGAISEASVHQETVLSLNAGTERLLRSAGAPEESVSRIAGAMTELARSAASSDQPVVVLTNDYALVLQTALGVGRPISRADLSLASASPAAFPAQGPLANPAAGQLGSSALGGQGF